jgi:hypothetical protein
MMHCNQWIYRLLILQVFIVTLLFFATAYLHAKRQKLETELSMQSQILKQKTKPIINK